MNQQQFKDRTQNLAIRIIKMTEALPQHSLSSNVISKQIVRSATSIGANYRAACRAQSPAAMIAKLTIVEEEADETLFWMEMLVKADIVKQDRLTALMQETNEILSMTVASIKTLKAKTKHSKA
jgi:four helix bundle protein